MGSTAVRIFWEELQERGVPWLPEGDIFFGELERKLGGCKRKEKKIPEEPWEKTESLRKKKREV